MIVKVPLFNSKGINQRRKQAAAYFFHFNRLFPKLVKRQSRSYTRYYITVVTKKLTAIYVWIDCKLFYYSLSIIRPAASFP